MATTETLNITGHTRSLYEMLIRDDPFIDTIVSNDDNGIETIRRLLSVSIVGFMLYGGGMGLAWQMLDKQLAGSSLHHWFGYAPLVTLPVALTGAFLIALLVCLPSFYFYTQLSGLDASFRLITAQALRVQARTAVLLLGALPIYIAVALGALIGAIDGTDSILVFGLMLPFIVGLAALASLQRSFARMAATLPVAHTRRAYFLPRMITAWGAVYTAVCPVALYRIGELLASITGR